MGGKCWTGVEGAKRRKVEDMRHAIRISRSAHGQGAHVLLLALVLTLGACQPAIVPETGAASELTFEITDTGLTVPQQATAGITTITASNTGQSPQSVTIARLNSDVTTEQFTERFQQDPESAVELVTLAGGRDALPGASAEFTVDLKPGTHVVVVFPVSEEDDAAPRTTFFTVNAGGSSAGTAPQAEVSVDLQDFAFVMPATLEAGQRTWELENAGGQWHEMFLVRPNEGVTQDELVAMLMSEDEPTGPPPWEDVAFLSPVSPGERYWVTLDLEPGTYTAICFLPDLESGESHFQKGMIQSFEVQGQ